MILVTRYKRWLLIVLALIACGALWFAPAGTFVRAEALTADPGAIFPVEEIIVETRGNRFRLTVEIADEAHERERGLMHRETMLPTHGMLFDFGRPGPVSMWMANTLIPLDMVFLDEKGRVARIEANTSPLSRKVISSGAFVSHVLELNAGMARQMGLRPGDRVLHHSFDQ